MTVLYVLDVPENVPVVRVAGQDSSLAIGRLGPYFEISSPGEIVIDRRATGCRHAVWYSFIGGLTRGTVVQHDKNAFRLAPA